MSKATDFTGISGTTFQFGLTGPKIKNNSGVVEARNAADSGYATFVCSLLNVTGNSLVINSDAAGSGADWSITIVRPSSGMTASWTLTLPVDDGTPGQVLSTDGSGVTSWATAGTTEQCVSVDSTDLAFGDSSPVTAFTLPADAVVHRVEVIVDTAFDGSAPSLSVGISGTTSKYMPATAIDLKTTGSYEYHPNLVSDGTTNAIILTYSASSSAAGAARILVFYSIPT